MLQHPDQQADQQVDKKNPKVATLAFSGEGGFLVTSNEKLMARAVIHSGSYGHYHTVRKHLNNVVYSVPAAQRLP